MRTLERMARTISPWRPRDIHCAQVIADAWDEKQWTYDIAVMKSGVGRNRLQHIRAKDTTAISVGETWALCVALGLDALDVLDGGDGRTDGGVVVPFPAPPSTGPVESLTPAAADPRPEETGDDGEDLATED